MTIVAEIPEIIQFALDAFGIRLRGIRSVKIQKSVDNFVARVSIGELNLVVRHHLCDSPSRVEFLCSILDRIRGSCGLAIPALYRTPTGRPYTIYKDRAVTLYDHLKGSHPESEMPGLLADLCRFTCALQELSVPEGWNGRVEAINPLDWQQVASAFTSEYANVITACQRDLILAAVSSDEDPSDLLGRFPTVIVHGDLHPANLLIDNSERLCAVIDFNDACLASSIIEYAGIARGFFFDNQAGYSVETCKLLFNEARIRLRGGLKLSDFTKLTGLVCLQYMLRLYKGQRTSRTPELNRLRTRAMWADFQRWHYLSLMTMDLGKRDL